MKIAELLIEEHQLIEKVMELIGKEVVKMRNGMPASPFFIEKIVDFIRTYADRCHHGKEEGIFFQALTKKSMSTELHSMMKELEREHDLACQTAVKLEQAKDKYRNGDPNAVNEIIHQMDTLTKFYPSHMEKEDRHFFQPCAALFSEKEQDELLARFGDFDRQLIHEKYKKVYEELTKR